MAVQQKAAEPNLVDRISVMAGKLTRYVPVAGTWAFKDGWCTDDNSPFAQTFAERGFSAVRARDGRPFRWTTNLAGLVPGRDERDWQAGADALYYFCEHLPYEDLNIIAHSHGGQVALFMAASGVKIRTLTTVGTPPRADVPAAAALANIGYWQHIFDLKTDWMGWLGQIGEGIKERRRSFRLAGMRDIPLRSIGHSSILRDPKHIPYWVSEGWLVDIQKGAAL